MEKFVNFVYNQKRFEAAVIMAVVMTVGLFNEMFVYPMFF